MKEIRLADNRFKTYKTAVAKMIVINCSPCSVQAGHKSDEISTHLQDRKELSKFLNELHSPFWRLRYQRF